MSTLDWVLAVASFVLGLGIFFAIGLANIDGVKSRIWVGAALTIYQWGGLLLLLAGLIEIQPVRLTLLLLLLGAEVIVVIGYLVHELLAKRRTGPAER